MSGERRVCNSLHSWTIYDEKEGKEIHLTPRQIEIIQNIQNHRYAEPGYNDETEYIPYFSGEASVLPWVGSEPPKVALHRRRRASAARSTRF